MSAIVPVVIDALNSEVITRHHYEAYGFFSPALGDYVRHGLYPYLLGSRSLAPHSRDRGSLPLSRTRPAAAIPKLLVNAAGDQFFLPDNSRFYFADLRGEKHLRYVPNAKHDLAGSDAQDTILAFYRAVLEERPRPRFAWRTLEDETIVVTAQDRPREVRLWQATNPEARDFRLDVIGKAWSSAVLAETSAQANGGRPCRRRRADTRRSSSSSPMTARKEATRGRRGTARSRSSSPRR